MKLHSSKLGILNVLIAVGLLCCSQPLLAQTGHERLYDMALSDYQIGKFASAYGRFMYLADQGHADSTRIALLMLRYGKELYGSEWTAAQSQIDSWCKRVEGVKMALKAESGD